MFIICSFVTIFHTRRMRGWLFFRIFFADVFPDRRGLVAQLHRYASYAL